MGMGSEQGRIRTDVSTLELGLDCIWFGCGLACCTKALVWMVPDVSLPLEYGGILLGRATGRI